MKIIWIGCHEEGVEAFRQVLESGYRVEAFITLDDSMYDKRSAGSRDYKTYCEKFDVKYYTVDTIKGESAYQIIEKNKPDLMIVLGWSEILPARILKIPSIGTIGTHASLLPHNRGSAPINWALIKGEKRTGNTMMWLSDEVDSGKIIDQCEFPITIFDTCKTLYQSVAETNAVMILRLLSKLSHGVKPVMGIENVSDEAILPRRHPEDGLIDWRQGAFQIYNFVRALTKPYPGAFSFLDNEKWIIWEAAVLPIKSDQCPGTILGTSCGFANNTVGLLISVRDGVLFVTRVEDMHGQQYTAEALYDLKLKGVFKDA